MPKKKKNDSHTPKWVPFAAILAPIVLVGCLMANNYRVHAADLVQFEQKEAARVEKKIAADARREHEQKIGWVLPSPPERNVQFAGIKVDVPVLPPIEYVVVHGQRKMVSESLSRRLFAIVENHPVEEIRIDMLYLLESGVLLQSWQAKPGLSARFLIVPPDQISWSSKTDGTLAEQPVLMINPEWLSALDTRAEILAALLVVYHEFQHYKQWVSGTQRDRDIMLSGIVPGLADSLGLTQEDACEHMWRSERAAYELECELANSWNETPVFGRLCEYAGTHEWDHALFMALVRSGGSIYRNECGKTMGKLAGHPYYDLL